MKKILLVCAAGMSTSMLVKRMIDHATAISLEVNISALAIAEAKGKDYGTMNGQAVLEFAMKLLQE